MRGERATHPLPGVVRGGFSLLTSSLSPLTSHSTVDAYKGRRILVTFGGAHKYWILDALRERNDVELLDVRPFLPPQR